MPRFAESDLERKPTAATFRGNTSSTLMMLGVSSCGMWTRTKLTEDRHKTDDDDHWLCGARRRFYEIIAVAPLRLRRFRRRYVMELLGDWAGSWPQNKTSVSDHINAWHLRVLALVMLI